MQPLAQAARLCGLWAMALRKAPVSRLGWHHYYVTRFNKTGHAQAEHMALWYLFLHLSESI